MAKEHQLEIENGRVTAQPTPIHYFHGLHKFYGGYGRGTDPKGFATKPTSTVGYKYIRTTTWYAYGKGNLFCANLL